MRVNYLLDTNILIDMRDNAPGIRRRVAELSGTLGMSVISRVELENGVFRDPSTAALKRQQLEVILAATQILPFDEASLSSYFLIASTVGYSRRKLLDRMIVAQALAWSATLITTNARDFSDIPNLTIISW